jgi:hypothetical protein
MRFAAAVRLLAAEARVLGLDVPGFRSPPRLPGADRSLRHRPGASPAIAVRLHGRPFEAVLADMIEGVVVANALAGAAAAAARARLAVAVEAGPADAAAA